MDRITGRSQKYNVINDEYVFLLLPFVENMRKLSHCNADSSILYEAKKTVV